jgi:hypothetical protein
MVGSARPEIMAEAHPFHVSFNEAMFRTLANTMYQAT